MTRNQVNQRIHLWTRIRIQTVRHITWK